MIKIRKNLYKPPQKLTGEICLELQKLSLTEKNQHKFSSSIYRDAAIFDLTALYKSKCGYCETDTSAGAALRVDHYRPKNKIAEDPEHPGYYWLGYEWSNLILSCEKCNRYKSNCFPIAGKRQSKPALNRDGTLNKLSLKSNSKILLGENPLLLNPEIDKSNDHFTFLIDGKITGLSLRGQTTISKCNLNREELILKRKKLIDELYYNLRRILLNFILTKDEKVFLHSIKIYFTNLKGLQNSNNKYSRLGFLLYNKFDFFFINRFHPKHKEILHVLYEKYKTKNI